MSNEILDQAPAATAGEPHVREIAWIEPHEAARRMRPLGGLSFLDSAMPHGELGRHSYVAAAPFGRFTVEEGKAAWNGRGLDGHPVDALRDLLALYQRPRLAGLPPFQGGAIGFFGYEFGRLLERLPAPVPAILGAVPEASLAFHDALVSFDHDGRRAFVVSTGLPEQDPAVRARRAADRAAGIEAMLGRPAPRPSPLPAVPRAGWRSNFTAEAYRLSVARVVEYVLDGDIFQANLAQRFEADLPPGHDPWAFYLRLRETNAATFAAYLEHGDLAVASSSPERFLKLDRDEVETRPIKGTAPRSPDPKEDARNAERLLASEKDRAENLMIVDLLRNDLSRVCRPHSVKTPSLCALETYAGVHHLVSAVTGTLTRGRSAVDLLAASFPGGSITGAPKLRAMEIITEIEQEARGVYCGAIGCLGFDGFLDTNIAIRTVTFRGGKASFHAGGGITALSEPEAEYRETLDKAERIFRAFEDSGEAHA
ncbi:aminodeoxychorismate synthase component I [Lutibaculum baratangense]|uniref:aminodeoxychorismate synthase n=1 Tax=Lutibaculum baratangense AMV1 TaxID=631454 RepID=V4RM06_9HYPH|nr:aminodeoxychorismate synthase component I [Lutibaculum baratangense]ESR27051.1 Para-aminobenzoate synthase, aminase component [Lutibaculum baratangense AMV1]